MSQFIAGISVTCFAASYLVALVLEISRVFFRARVSTAILMLFAVAGLIAQSLYLGHRFVNQLPDSPPLSSWEDWCLLAAWIVVAAYMYFSVMRPDTLFGLFLLPLVLVLVGVSYLTQGIDSFSPSEALFGWRYVHGFALLGGTAVVTLGCAAGVMFLVQSYRLKHRLPPSQTFRLPSLERLQWASERSLVVGSCLLLVGLLSGIIMNLIKHTGSDNHVPWSDPVVWTSGVLFAWLVAASAFNYFYTPARRGRKVAYLVVASFVFLGLELGVVLLSQHASSNQASPKATPSRLMPAPSRQQSPLLASVSHSEKSG